MEKQKEEMSAEEFRLLARETYPHIMTLLETVQKHNIKKGIDITIDPDGWINMRIMDDGNHWTLYRLPGDDPVIEHSYLEPMELKEE